MQKGQLQVRMLLAATLIVSLPAAHVSAQTLYGSLGNFDCVNDTGQVAHGFEIELDNCLPSDVYGTFGAPYNRYGDPTITTDGVNTFIRYASTYDTNTSTWAVGTDPGSLSDTGGHSLYYSQYGGDPAYPNVPGDHFGVALNISPTNTIYHWLLDGGGGSLVQAGTTVKVPAPILNVAPPVNPGNVAAVQAVIQAPAPENPQLFGEAIWAKVYTTVVENAGPAHLEDLVLGNAAVPPETETEIEWHLLQFNPENPAGSELEQEVEVGNGHESVTRRYEFFAYTGGYDPENHEALHDNYNPAYVGDYLGTQNVAANFAIPEPSTFVLGLFAFVALGFAVRRNTALRI